MITLSTLFTGEKHIYDRLTRSFAEIERRLDNIQNHLEMLENHIADLEYFPSVSEAYQSHTEPRGCTETG